MNWCLKGDRKRKRVQDKECRGRRILHCSSPHQETSQWILMFFHSFCAKRSFWAEIRNAWMWACEREKVKNCKRTIMRKKKQKNARKRSESNGVAGCCSGDARYLNVRDMFSEVDIIAPVSYCRWRLRRSSRESETTVRSVAYILYNRELGGGRLPQEWWGSLFDMGF